MKKKKKNKPTEKEEWKPNLSWAGSINEPLLNSTGKWKHLKCLTRSSINIFQIKNQNTLMVRLKKPIEREESEFEFLVQNTWIEDEMTFSVIELIDWFELY